MSKSILRSQRQGISAAAGPISAAKPAAGAVLWRPGSGSSAPEVAIVHRPRYDDWSLPKGKVGKGETEPVTAVREVRGAMLEICGFAREGAYLPEWSVKVPS